MTWLVRLATADDYQAVSGMAKENMQECAPDREWSEERFRRGFLHDHLEDKATTLFVIEQDGDVCGFLLTGLYEYRAFHGHFAVQEVIYVRPDKRGTRAAALLMQKLIEWGRMAGALEIVGGNDNGPHSETLARFLTRFGFRFSGYSMRLDLSNGR